MPLMHALGTTVRVDLGEDIDIEEFAQAWSRCLTDDTDDAADTDDTAEIPTVTAQRSMTALTQSITGALIERCAGQVLMLHAGAVCHPETGRSVAYIAPGGTGKTTLTRLLGQDYGYLTDETVAIEPGSWRIRPYEKPLSLRGADGGFPKSEHGPDSLGLKRAHPEPSLSTLMVIRRSTDHEAPRFNRPDFLDIIPDLVPETSSLTKLDKPLHLLADLHEALGGIWLVEYAEAEQLRDWVSERLEQP